MNFCPHCHSGNDPVLKATTWACGVRFNDSLWRTKECYDRQNARLKKRIKRLEREVYALRLYGNRDCTAMADQALKEGEL